MRVLFIDHSKVFRSVWERMVLHAGHEPLIAGDGLTALAMLQAYDIDFICVSLSLPDTDGIRLTRQVRAQPKGRDIPIILLTSARDNLTRKRAFEAGVTDIYPKTGIEALFQRAQHWTTDDDKALNGRVLYVEDSRTVTAVMTQLMQRMGLEVEHYVSASVALENFDPQRHDLVISDILVEGDMSGISLVSELRRQYPDKIRTPILAMSGMDDEIRRIELFRLGINDFITKPVIAEEAASRIRNLVVQKQLFDQVQQQRIQLYEMAMTDPLTGLYNRNSLSEFASKISSAANRHDMALSVIVIDLDHFKAVNDTHGHLAGDQVLAAVGEAMLNSCRQEDFAVRFGGEEILLILPHCSLEDASERAELIRARVERLKPAGIRVTASIGVSAKPSGRAVELQQLIRIADQAVYQAKASGRNQVVIHPLGPDTAAETACSTAA